MSGPDANSHAMYLGQPLAWTENEGWFEEWSMESDYGWDDRTPEDMANVIAKVVICSFPVALVLSSQACSGLTPNFAPDFPRSSIASHLNSTPSSGSLSELRTTTTVSAFHPMTRTGTSLVHSFQLFDYRHVVRW